jgi:hypothetical protein
MKMTEPVKHRNRIKMIAKTTQSYKFILRKIQAGDADYTMGRVVSMCEVEIRTQAVVDRAVVARLA